MAFPETRLRRLRVTRGIRELVCETELTPAHLVQPIFTIPGESRAEPVVSMPGIDRLTADRAAEEAERLHELGAGAVLLFGVPEQKDDEGSGAWSAEGAVQRTVAAIKQRTPDLIVITDVCLCAYTTHGHCGVLGRSGDVDNDETLKLLERVAISHAAAGADAVAPSDMMDGRVGALRRALDEDDFKNTAIVAYSAKFASAYYGPFRDAADSTPAKQAGIAGDRRGYQMDPANAREAVREAVLDEQEGADIVMVKPGLPYLDVIRRVRDAVATPVAVYNVSGEYSMVKAAVAAGYLDERAAVTETLLSFRRAGADIIISYHAKDFATWNQ